MKDQEKQVFSTRDLYLASTLVTLRFFMTGIDYVVEGSKNNPVGFFKFEDSALLQETKNKYQQSLLSVEPKAFVTNMHALKAEVVNVQNNPHL